jgi:hypothetical protein
MARWGCSALRGESAATGVEVPAAGAVPREMVLLADTPLGGDVKEVIARQLGRVDGRLAVLTGEDEPCSASFLKD